MPVSYDITCLLPKSYLDLIALEFFYSQAENTEQCSLTSVNDFTAIDVTNIMK